MSNLMIVIHNVETGEIIERPMNDEELTQWQDDEIKLEKQKEELSKAAKAKAALLEKLGITEEEAKLLLS